MKKFLITFQDPKSGSCDNESIYCLNLKAAKMYAEKNKQGWEVQQVIAL